MQTHKNNELMLDASIITVGAFDGLHRGHQSLIKRGVKAAKHWNIPFVVYTFDPPPRVLFQHKQVLTTVTEKLKILKRLGVDHVIIADFDDVYAAREAFEFIQELHQLQPKEIIVGPDFTFGKNKQGNVHYLSQYFKVLVQPFVRCEKGMVISSTRIRRLMDENRRDQIEYLLGRQNLEIINS